MKFIFFKIISLVLLFCKIIGQTATTLRQKFQSFDRLGYIENGGLNVNFNPYPQQVYQIMTQHPNGTVNVLMWIDNENKTNWAQHCSPQIVLPKMNRRVGFRNTHKIKISTLYNKAQPIHQKLFHLFQISIDLSDHQMSSQNGRIVLMIMKQGHTLNGTIVNINGVSLMQSNTSNTAFFLTDIKNLSFQGVIDLDSIVDYAIKNNLISQSNVIRQVRLVSQNTQGVFSLSISYCMIFDFLVYLKNGSNGTIAELGWYLEINHTNFNQSEYLQIQTIQTPIKLSDIKFVCNILPTSTTYKGSFQIRVGYYKSWVTPFEAYRFPLDPKQTSTNFIAQTVFTYSNQPTNKVSICWILRARSDFNNISQQFNNQTISAEKEIHICPFISSSLELPVIQEFIVSDTLNNKYLFRYSQISGTPSVFTFWTTSGTITGGLDLFQFLTRLVNTNKFGPNDLISGLSFAFKVYSYSGNFVVHRINLLCGSNEYLVSSSPQICRACALSINGCLHCLNSSYCLTCLNKDWLLQNGVCKCSDGFMQSESGISAKCLPAIKFNTSLSCLLMDEGQTLETCINSPSVKTSTILTFVSVPNMALFIRVSQIYTFIDDFTYYVYHNMSYGVKFDLFVKFMWNLTNERFIPHSIAKFYYNIQDQYDKQIDAKTLTYVPEGWADLGQGATFLSNTRDCWLCLFPLNILIFLFFNSIYRVLAHFQSRFAVKLTAFKWVSIFVFSLFSQNIQFISFRSFQHILYAGPPSSQPSVFVYIANYFTCYFFLFFFVIFACFGIGVLRYILQANILYGLDFAKYSLQTLWFYGIINFFRMFIGFTHAWFYQDNYAQFILLSLSQITVLIAIICFRDIFKLKSFLTFMMNEYIFRAALHCYLFITVQLKASGESLSENVANEFDETALFLVIVIMLFSFLESFSLMLFSLQLKISSDYINKKSNKQVKQKSFKLNKLSILHKKISERKSQAENGILQSCNPPVFKDTTQRLQKKQVEVFQVKQYLQKPIIQIEKPVAIKKETPYIVQNWIMYTGSRKKRHINKKKQPKA